MQFGTHQMCVQTALDSSLHVPAQSSNKESGKSAETLQRIASVVARFISLLATTIPKSNHLWSKTILLWKHTIPAMRPASQEEVRGDRAEMNSLCGKYIKAALNNRAPKCLHAEFTAVNARPRFSARVVKVYWLLNNSDHSREKLNDHDFKCNIFIGF